jgi:hypothetical protein
MRASVVLFIMAAACAKIAVPDLGPTRAFTFRVAEDSAAGDTLVGTAYVGSHEIRVVLRAGVGAFHQTPYWVPKTIAAGLAYPVGTNRWEMRAESKRVAMNRVRVRGDTLADSVVLLIPRPDQPLTGHWLVIQQYGEMPVPGVRGIAMQATRSLHSAEGLFRERAP